MIPSGVRHPPGSFLGALRHMGPGLILSAAIVGSGELIATTTLGAKAGFSLLWVILLGCTVKVAVQLEYGRFCITHGLPSLQAWNHVGRVRWKGLHWTVYIGALYMLANMAGQGGVLGGASQVMHHAVPILPLSGWVVLIVVSVGALIAHGRYGPVEWGATALNLVFVSTVLYCVIAIQRTPYAFTGADLAGGFSFRIPREIVGLAVAAFGITGLAAGEITMYPYWCLEKGYARWTGPDDGTPEWRARARGWIRVMRVDALASMLVYTTATCAFYILGATVLRQQPTLEDGNAFILQLSTMFTEVLGTPSQVVFMICAFTVLYSTLFANAAGFSRLWTDLFGLLGWLDWNNERRRTLWIGGIAALFPIGCAVVYFLVQKPLLLVTFMGICNALFLLVVAYQTVIFRLRHTPEGLRPSKLYDISLILSLVAIGFMAARAVHGLLNG